MDPKDFKFDDNAFDDVFSSSEKNGFEDIYSNGGGESLPEDDFAEKFEDIFSGKTKNDSGKDDYDLFADEYFKNNSEVMTPPSADRRRESSNVRRNPYSYNYDRNAQRKAQRVSQKRFDDDISEDISSGRQRAKGNKSKSAAKGIFKAVLIIILIVLVVAVVLRFLFAKSLTEKVNYSELKANEYISSAELLTKDGVKNILLVGVDAREGESNSATRSDTMMLLSIDDNNKQLKLTSFLRDTYIDIPGYKTAKLNASQSYGGTQLLVDTLEYNFKIDIDNYVLVNFDMFTTVIDALGGVDVEVSEKEAKYINSRDHMTSREKNAFPDKISGGVNHFNGEQALWYSRIRYLDSDFMRTQRQRKVISAALSKFKSANPADLVKMLNNIMPMLETDLDSDNLMKLGTSSIKYIFYDLAQQQIPAPDTWRSGRRRGQDVLLIDLEENREILKNFVFEKAEIEELDEKNK